MIEALSDASGPARPAPAPRPTSIGTPGAASGDFGDVYADAAAPPAGGCQCDRNASAVEPMRPVAPIRRTGSALAPAPRAPAGPIGMAGADGPIGASDADVRPGAAGRAGGGRRAGEPDPFRTPECGQCGLPFALPGGDEVSAASPPVRPAPAALAVGWSPIPRHWIRDDAS